MLLHWTLDYRCNGMVRMTSQDAIVEKNREMLLQRSIVGIRKYGITLDKQTFPLKRWLQLALEECLDQANYLQGAITEIERQEQQ